MNDLSKKFIFVIVAGIVVSAILMLAGIKPGIFVGLAIIGIGGALITKNHEDNMSSSYGEGLSQEHSRYNRTKQNISSNTEVIETTAIEESAENNESENARYNNSGMNEVKGQLKKEWDEFKDKYSEDDPSTMKDDIARGLLGAATDFMHSEKGMESERKYYERQERNARTRGRRRGF